MERVDPVGLKEYCPLSILLLPLAAFRVFRDQGNAKSGLLDLPCTTRVRGCECPHISASRCLDPIAMSAAGSVNAPACPPSLWLLQEIRLPMSSAHYFSCLASLHPGMFIHVKGKEAFSQLWNGRNNPIPDLKPL